MMPPDKLLQNPGKKFVVVIPVDFIIQDVDLIRSELDELPSVPLHTVTDDDSADFAAGMICQRPGRAQDFTGDIMKLFRRVLGIHPYVVCKL